MVLVRARLNCCLRIGAIAGWLLVGGVACQRSVETPEVSSTPETADETADTSTPAAEPARPGADETVPDEETAGASAQGAADGADNPTDPAAIAQTCSASAFVIDPDPAGLNVRSGPGSDYSVIDTLPTDGPVEVTISGSANGWMKLEVAWSMQQQELEQPGWVYAPLLGVTTTDGDADKDGPVLLFSTPDASQTNVKAEVSKYAEASLLSCSGDWLQVQVDGRTGWLAADDQCSSPVTTCP